MGFSFELDDETVLRLSGVAASVYAVQFFGCPKPTHELYYEEGRPYDKPTCQWFGYAVGGLAGNNFTISALSNSRDAKKAHLKFTGAGWLGSAALHLYNAHEGYQKKELAYGNAAIAVALGALCLWRGFTEEDKKKDKKE